MHARGLPRHFSALTSIKTFSAPLPHYVNVIRRLLCPGVRYAPTNYALSPLVVPIYSTFKTRPLSYRVILHQGTIRKTPAIANGSSHGRGFASPRSLFIAPPPLRRRPLVKVPQIAQKNRERSFSAVSAPGVRYHR